MADEKYDILLPEVQSQTGDGWRGKDRVEERRQCCKRQMLCLRHHCYENPSEG